MSNHDIASATAGNPLCVNCGHKRVAHAVEDNTRLYEVRPLDGRCLMICRCLKFVQATEEKPRETK